MHNPRPESTSVLVLFGDSDLARCVVCHAPGPYAPSPDQQTWLPVPHVDTCAAAAEETALLRDDTEAAEHGVAYRPCDAREGDQLAGLGLDVDTDALVRVELVDGRRTRWYALVAETLAVTW